MGIMDNIRNAVEEGKPGIVTRLLSKIRASIRR